MNSIIRKGEEGDVKDLLRLIKELAQYEKALGEVEVSEEELLKDCFGGEKLFDFIIAEVDGIIAGIALYYFKYSTWKGRCIYLEDLIVSENYRGNGIGAKLFEEVASISKKLKVKRMEWQVLDWNEPAIQFYKKYEANLDAEWINCKLIDEQLSKF